MIKTLITCVGLSRSGSYATRRWCFDQFDGPKSPNKKFIRFIWKYARANTKDTKRRISKNMHERLGKKKIRTLQLKFENEKIKRVPTLVNFVKARNKLFVLLLRDPFNQIASVLQFSVSRPNADLGITADKTIKKWKEYAREFLGDTSFLKNKVIMNYNTWFADQSYRRTLSRQIDGDRFSDESINKVHGPGSSFDNSICNNNRARDMKVLKRWERMIDNATYIRYISDEELLSLSRRVYPDLTSQICKNLGGQE